MKDRRELEEEVAREERRLAELARDLERQRQVIASLRAALNRAAVEPRIAEVGAESVDLHPDLSNLEKVHLFRSLFRGREDVFPRRWENRRTGRSGYAPACENEWDSTLCAKIGAVHTRKRRNVCGECRNQRFLAVTDEQVANHLRGLHVMGVYPLLPDETCWFLAADFDGASWGEDVGAFAETCRAHELGVSIERSRSGDGAHAWFFFAEPVPAGVARKMGCFLLTQTMARRHQLSMRSYDRLFPNQDTMPKGGFGNLIALPLQREARIRGSTLFLDDHLSPLPDQWAYLSGLTRIGAGEAHAVAREAVRTGQTIGYTRSASTDDDEARPACLEVASPRTLAGSSEPLSSSLSLMLDSGIRILKAGSPSSLLNQIKRLATFQNPEFYKRQSLRLSTAMTPRVIACFEESAEFIRIPRGCLSELEALLQACGIKPIVEDDRELGAKLDVAFKGRLTEEQEGGLSAALPHETGVLVAPPGVGKTVAGIALIASRGRSTLVLVHRKPLLDQWSAQIALFLGLSSKDIGQIGGGKHRPNGLLDVAMIQSLVRKGQVDELVRGYGHILVDECHHLSAVSFEKVLSAARAKYVTGLTATPRRRDGHEPIIHMQLGPIRQTVRPRGAAAFDSLIHRLVVRETGFDPGALPEGATIQEVYAVLAKDSSRNDLIFDDVIAALEAGRSPVVLTERRDHLEHFAERLQRFAKHLVVFHGGMKARERREALQRCREIPAQEERVLLATGRFLGEGFDDSRLDTLFLTLPVSWRGTLVQYTGRLHRAHSGKREAIVYDYLDERVPVLRRMFERRLRGYRTIGYELPAVQP
jgi:superfamily II DNA or RNA helicase